MVLVAWVAQSELGANEGVHSDGVSLQRARTCNHDEVTRAFVLDAVAPLDSFHVIRLLITAVGLKIHFRNDTFGWVTVHLRIRWLDRSLLIVCCLDSFLGSVLLCQVRLSLILMGIGNIFGLGGIDYSLVDCIRGLDFLSRRIVHNSFLI